MILSLLIILSCSTFCLNKPLSTEMPFLHNHTASHQSRDQYYHSQDTFVQPELEYIENAENEVTSSKEGFFNTQVVSKRIARGVNNSCFDKEVRKWDSCRKKYVTRSTVVNIMWPAMKQWLKALVTPLVK